MAPVDRIDDDTDTRLMFALFLEPSMSTLSNSPLILLVDDQSSMRKMVKQQLESAGYRNIQEADSGQEALEALNERLFDLVILDWTMPQMTGLEVLKRIRSTETLNRVKVMMLTAEGLKKNVIEAIQSGANGYVLKPFTQQTLLKKVASALPTT